MKCRLLGEVGKGSLKDNYIKILPTMVRGAMIIYHQNRKQKTEEYQFLSISLIYLTLFGNKTFRINIFFSKVKHPNYYCLKL